MNQSENQCEVTLYGERCRSQKGHKGLHDRDFIEIAPEVPDTTAPFSYKDSNVRDTATAKAILLAHIDEAQMLYDVTVNTPDAPKGLIEFMDRHLDDLRAKKVS
jgi:hypothetical protein